MIDKYEMYQKVLKDIAQRTNLEIDNMSLADKTLIKSIMEALKGDLDQFLDIFYDYMMYWCNYDLKSEILSTKEPDYNKINELLGVLNNDRFRARI